MRNRLLCVVSSAVLCLSAANASTVVGLDYVLAFDGTTLVFGDDFNAPTLESPPWFVVSGSPLIADGSALQMHGDDAIIAALSFSGTADATVIVQANLTDFTGDAALAVQLIGPQSGDLVGMVLTPNVALASDESGPLGAIPYTPGATAQLVLTTTASGDFVASVDGVPVFSGPDSFGSPVQVVIAVVPEPGTMLTLAGLGALLWPRRR